MQVLQVWKDLTETASYMWEFLNQPSNALHKLVLEQYNT